MNPNIVATSLVVRFWGLVFCNPANQVQRVTGSTRAGSSSLLVTPSPQPMPGPQQSARKRWQPILGVRNQVSVETFGGIRAEIMSGRESILALAGSRFDALSVSQRWKMVLAAWHFPKILTGKMLAAQPCRSLRSFRGTVSVDFRVLLAADCQL